MSDTPATVLSLETTGADGVPAFVSRLRSARFTSPSGVESVFLYDSLSRTRAKKGAVHDPVDADDTILQDLGSSLQVFPIAAYFTGADCDRLADAFYASLFERYTPDAPGILNHPRWGDITVIPFGEPEQSEEYVSGAGISRVTVTFRETRSKKTAKSAALTSAEIAANAAASAESALERARRGIATTKAAYAQFSAHIRGKVKAITDVIDTISGVADDVVAEAEAITQDIYSALDEGALPVTILSQLGNLMVTVASTPIHAGAMALGYAGVLTNLITEYVHDLDAAVTADTRRTVAHSYQYVGSVATGCIARAAMAATYETRDEVAEVVDSLVDAYAAYLAQLDAAALALADGIVDTFVPDHDAGSLLQAVVLDAQAALIDRAFSLKSARPYTLAAPSDPLTETWTHYGDLGRLDFFCKTNNIGGSEFVELAPGRRLVYYA